jgi:ELWxxDGT repeat protein
MFPGAAQGAFNFARETHLFSAGSWMFFFGATAQGTGVHRTDGTVANTQLVLPLSQDVLTNATETVYALGNYLLVSLRTGELFSIDATTGAHVQAATTSRFTPLGILGGKLLFDGSGVWTTDGTAAGTHPTDVLPVPNSPLYSGQIVGNRLFFISTATFIPTLYVTDGTGAGTHAIMTINQGSSVGDSGFSIGNFYFFRHDDGVHGMELWRTDGTTAALFADINPGYRTGLDLLTGFTRPDGKVLFAAMNYDSGREPWITDGTTAGTHLLKNLAADGLLSGSSPRLLRASGNSLFFTADLNGGQAIGTSDGTGGGTSANLVDFSTTIQSASAANGHYFFNTLSPDYTSRFYASDGTSAGTTVISEQAGTGQPLPHGFAFLQGANELWFSDGTIAGTHELHAFGSFEAVRIFPGGAVAWIANGPELWKTDGSDAGSIQVVPNPAPTQSILDLTVSGSAIYFIESSYSDHGYRLWRSDGTAAGTTMVKDLGANGLPSFIGATDQMVYLSVGGKLYRSDGTANGTIALPVDGPCLAAASLDGALLFMSSTTIPPFTGSTTITLWRSDGSAAGTTALQVMQPAKTDPGGCGPVVVRGNNAYFSGWDAAHGWELWQSNGTASGTQLTADIYPGTKSSSPQELTLAGNLLFFSADSPNIGRELWAVGPQNISRHRAVRP